MLVIRGELAYPVVMQGRLQSQVFSSMLYGQEVCSALWLEESISIQTINQNL